MAEYQPGTDIVIPNNVPTSGFRCAIPNSKRYMKHNKKTLADVAEASFTGDYDALEELLKTGDEQNLFNGDVNAFHSHTSPLQLASMAGQIECVELLLQAKADPHARESMPYGQDPEDGRTALGFAREWGHDDVAEVLEQAAEQSPHGWYLPAGPGNNAKVYGTWGYGKKPAKGSVSSRPGVAEICGFDAGKYGTGALNQEVSLDDDILDDAGLVSVSVARGPGRAGAVKTVPVGLLFPGQGSQYVKMMATAKEFPRVQEMLRKAREILGYDVLELCLNGPESKLEETKFCQPAMFVAGMAGLEKLRNEREEAATSFQVAAGLSLGEYTALCAAGVFSFEDGLRLVKLRGEAMQEAAAVGKQAMLSVAGIEKPKLVELCAQAQKKEGGKAVCQIANELFPKGFSCAGTEAAVLALKDLAEKAGALQAKVLKTSGGFHTPLMSPAKDRLGKALDAMLPKMSPPMHTIYMNANAKPLKPGTDPREIVETLKMQLTSPVLWEPSVREMIKAGVTEFYEVGPMKQIKAMMKRIDSKVWSSTHSIEI